MMWSLTTALLFFLVQATDYNAEGLKALDAQKYEEAAQAFTKAVAADPKDYAAHFYLALANTMLRKDAEAVSEYRKALELKPGLYEAELNLGMVLVRDKQPGEAIPLLESASQKKPKEFRPRLYLADAYLASGDAAKAEQAYQAAAELDPKSAPAQLGLGRAIARQNRLQDAAPHFHKAAELDPAFKDALLELAALYEKNKQPEQAIAIYKQFPGNTAAQERMGELLLESGRAADAIPELEAAVQKSPTAANRLALAMAYRRSGQLDKAVALLQQAVESEPNNLDLRMIYGRNLRDQKNFQAAAREFYTVAKAKPDSIEAWNELAGMLVSMEQYPQALAVLDKIKSLGVETPGHMFLRAIALDRLKDAKGALASYQAFLAASQGKHPDEEFKARQRVRLLEREINKR